MILKKGKFKIGPRTIKTGLAVGLSMFLVEISNLQSPLFAGIGAISSMQTSVSESFISGRTRMLGTFVGAIIGIIFSTLMPNNYVFLGLGIILTISINNYFGWNKSLTLACYVYLSIFLNSAENRIPYATYRLLSTFVGIVVATLINYFVATPDVRQEFIEQKSDIYNNYKKLVFDLIAKEKTIDSEDLTSDLDKLVHSFELYQQEINYHFSKSKITNTSIKVITMLDEVSAHLNTLLILDIKPVLNDENIILFEEVYKLNYTPILRESCKEDIIYNYHLNRVLNNLIEIEKILND